MGGGGGSVHSVICPGLQDMNTCCLLFLTSLWLTNERYMCVDRKTTLKDGISFRMPLDYGESLKGDKGKQIGT